MFIFNGYAESCFRGSSSNTGVVKEPFVGPVMELFHENEVDDLEDEIEAEIEMDLLVSDRSTKYCYYYTYNYLGWGSSLPFNSFYSV